jgi:hypothetical protein
MHSTSLTPQLTTARGIRTLSPAQCWLLLASESPLEELVITADAMTRRRHPTTSLDALNREVAAATRTPGLPRARKALSLTREGTDSVRESMLRLILVMAGIPEPVVNYRVITGGQRYYLDLAYPEVLLAVEYDGLVHVGDRTRMTSDAQRRLALEDAGWRIMTFTSESLRTPNQVIREVSEAIKSRRTLRTSILAP